MHGRPRVTLDVDRGIRRTSIELFDKTATISAQHCIYASGASNSPRRTTIGGGVAERWRRSRVETPGEQYVAVRGMRYMFCRPSHSLPAVLVNGPVTVLLNDAS
ncbi:hypothetical protein PUNSTDRAFT_53065 [Punctularia strigosozonata HHB-11173 SS5]|uniref:uncharacterized protein n=1 Tax=Punctularia strigosozonata (strain HHB-11173) TaxID=741275 RepID=UPI0004416B10|nr:uncharacterized protein PUNSTDRAFT_53065 [Punctularia strigosozonata HHB-11173 SS5]EIN07661.1 hypothetical protein PUNSTDRAFT_53065 [Punctularia strigosozonata HHB-11173 SS5]